MIVLIGSRKGGCGKSTLSVNLATQLVCDGFDVALLDADQQGTTSNWVADRNALALLPLVNCVRSFGNISAAVLDLASRHEHVIADAAARDSQELRTGMGVADLLLVPCRPSQADLDTLSHMHQVIKQAKSINPKLKAKMALTMASTNPRVSEAEEARQYAVNYPHIEVLAHVVHDRKVYRDALSLGKGVVEMNNPRARSEMRGMTREIMK